VIFTHCKGNTTGTHSVFSTHLGLSIMYHVSTLLPYTPNDPQQVSFVAFIVCLLLVVTDVNSHFVVAVVLFVDVNVSQQFHLLFCCVIVVDVNESQQVSSVVLLLLLM
jgi:hypothetical protein